MKESTAILLGSIVIATAILISGGIIKIGNLNFAKPGGSAASASPLPAGEFIKGDYVANFKTIAKKLSLDQGKFDKCLDSGEKASLVDADLSEGEKVGVSGTPAFLINGHLVGGALPYTTFKDILEYELIKGDWNNTPADLAYLTDGNDQNGEITKDKKDIGVGNLPPQGKEGAGLTIIEFSDYECPFCGRFFSQTEGQIKKEYVDTGKALFYYRDFPLKQIHPGAQKGAEAARCAGDQDKYWQYHDLVLQNQSQIF